MRTPDEKAIRSKAAKKALLPYEASIKSREGQAADTIVQALVPDVRTQTAKHDVDPIPLARILSTRQDDELVYAMVRVDPSGRVADKLLLSSVSWNLGERIALTTTATSITLRPQRSGVIRINREKCIAIPAPARHALGIKVGARVLLAAIPRHRIVIVYPLSTLDTMLSNFHASCDM